MALDTVQDYVNAARGYLQDKVAPYRYADSVYLEALSFALLEAKRVRADLFIGVATVPSYTANDTTAVSFEQVFRTALPYYMAGHVQMQDEEDTEDSRAAAFIARFNTVLLGGSA